MSRYMATIGPDTTICARICAMFNTKITTTIIQIDSLQSGVWSANLHESLNMEA